MGTGQTFGQNDKNPFVQISTLPSTFTGHLNNL